MPDQSWKYARGSFADKLRAGWTKEQLMKYYRIDEEKYEKILTSLKNIEETRESG